MLIDPHYEAAGRPGRLRSALQFRLDPADRSESAIEGNDDRYCAWKRGMFRNLGVKMADKFWTWLPTDHPSLPAVVDELERYASEGTARPGAGSLSMWIEDDESRPVEWFVVQPRRSFDFDRVDPFTVKACNLPASLRLGGQTPTFASESVRHLAEREGLTGLEWLWVRDTGRYEAAQWYELMPTRCLGRGIDHPWFDWNAFRTVYFRARGQPGARGRDLPTESFGMEALGSAGIDSWRRHAARQFGGEYCRPDRTTGDSLLDRFLTLFPSGGRTLDLTVVAFPRVLRRFLPGTDVAFLWGAPHPDARDQPGEAGELCVNRRTRDLWVREGVASPDEFLGVAILDDLPADAIQLDAEEHPAPARLTPERLSAFRDEEARAWMAFKAKARPRRPSNLGRALALLRSAKTRSPDRFGKRAGARSVESLNASLPVSLPDDWGRILKIADGFEVPGPNGETVNVTKSADLLEFHTSTMSNIADVELEVSPRWIVVGHTSTGDLLVFDVPEDRGPGVGDHAGSVLLVSHETHVEVRRWAGVAEFLEELFA